MISQENFLLVTLVLFLVLSGIGIFVVETVFFKKSKSIDSKQNNKDNRVLDNNSESKNENKNLLNKEGTSNETKGINNKLTILLVVAFLLIVGGLYRYEDFKSNISVCDYLYYSALDRAYNVDDYIASTNLISIAMNDYQTCIDNA